jgi:hypothetical protein
VSQVDKALVNSGSSAADGPTSLLALLEQADSDACWESVQAWLISLSSCALDMLLADAHRGLTAMCLSCLPQAHELRVVNRRLANLVDRMLRQSVNG